MIAMCQERQFAPQQTADLFDHLVGALLEEPRDFEPDRLRSLEVDDQVELRRLLDR